MLKEFFFQRERIYVEKVHYLSISLVPYANICSFVLHFWRFFFAIFNTSNVCIPIRFNWESTLEVSFAPVVYCCLPLLLLLLLFFLLFHPVLPLLLLLFFFYSSSLYLFINPTLCLFGFAPCCLFYNPPG